MADCFIIVTVNPYIELTLNNILKTDPKYGEAYRLLGLCQIQLKKTDEACGNFKKAKELGDPNADELITKYCK